MFTWIWIFQIVLFGAAAAKGPEAARAAAPGAHNLTCEVFERDAHFDPTQIIDSTWKIFYFWGDNTEMYPIVFTLPTKKRMKKIMEVVDSVDPDLGVQWYTAQLLMEPRPGLMVVLLFAGTPGAYRALVVKQQRDKVRPLPEPLIKFADIRIKLVGRYIAMMCCEENSLYVMARMEEMPMTDADCEAAAANTVQRKLGGRSYLYVEEKIRQYGNEL